MIWRLSMAFWRALATISAVIMLNVTALANPAPGREIKLIAYGDSLMAGLNLPRHEAFPAQLEKALRDKGYNVSVADAGVSGDTSAAALERIDWVMGEPADAVILELGGNDALRGIDPKELHKNLDKLITGVKAKGAAVLLAGMQAPLNWGDDYKKAFDAVYPELAAKHQVQLYPFFLDGVALDKRYILDDGLHPKKEGITEIVNRILPTVEKLIAALPNASAPSN